MDPRPPPPRRKRRGREELESLDLLATQMLHPPPARGRRMPITFHPPPPELPPPAQVLPFGENNAAPLSSWGQRWHSWDPVHNRAEPLSPTPQEIALVALPERQSARLPLPPSAAPIYPSLTPQARSYTRPREWSAEDDVRAPSSRPRISRSQRKLLEVQDLAEQRQWTMVSEHVRTRSAAQCRNRWELLKGVLATDASGSAPAEEARARPVDDTEDTDYSDSADVGDRDAETEAAAKTVRVHANAFQEADDAVIREYMLQGRQPHTEIWCDRHRRIPPIARDTYSRKALARKLKWRFTTNQIRTHTL